MKLFLKNVVIILVVALGLSTLISAGSLWALRSSSFYKPSFLVNDVTDATFDYIIIGASTGLTTLNTHVIDSIAATRGLNLSMDDTTLSSHYLMLEHFIAQGKMTSYCILAPSNTSYDMKVNRLSGNDYRFLPYIGKTYVSDYYHQYETRESKILEYSQFLPMLGVSYYNSELFYPSIKSLFHPRKRNRYDAQGNYSYPGKNIKDEPISNRKSFEVDFSNSYVSAIKALCEANGIQLICYFTPMETRSVEVVNSNYTSINHSAILSNRRYFYDGIHVNSLGREEASIAFAKEFIELKNQ